MKNVISVLAVLGTFFVNNNVKALTLDGVLNEKEWQSAQVSEKFVTTYPYSLAQPEYKTELRVFTDSDGIYIGLINHQPLSTQRANRTSRDAFIEADFNNVVIDFDGSGSSAYSFSVGNGGSMRDGTYRNENSYSNEWNGVWYAKTSSDDDHWYTEIHIPWGIAPMIAAKGELRNIGLNISRNVVALGKTYSNQPIAASRQRFLSDLSAIAINDFSGASLQSFASLTARKDNVANETTVAASLDLFWKPNSSKQLSLTINPDFGHVDSDDLVVNFSPTETFFSENRAFFTENQSLFTLQGPDRLRLIHTRRIGGQPDVGSSLGADINGAVKFTNVDEDFSYGFFSALEDGDNDAKGRDYYAGRIMRKAKDYNLGYLLTYTDRPDINRSALVQAVDYGYFFNENIAFSGQVINSQVKSNTDEYNDLATWFELEQQFNDDWKHSFTASYYGDQLEVNDLGFLPRNDLISLAYENKLVDHDFSTTSIIKEHEVTAKITHKENNEDVSLLSTLSFTEAWALKDTRWMQWRVTYETQGHDDLLTRGNNIVNLQQGLELDLFYSGETIGKLRYHLHGTMFDRTVKGKGYMVHVHPSYNFTDNYALTFGAWYTQSDDWLLWKDENKLASYQQQQLTTRADFNATLGDKQELTVRFQWVALKALGLKHYQVDSRGDLNTQADTVDDFSLSDVAIQLRYRYEIAPLSNVYIVYSRGGTVSLDEDEPFSKLFSPGWEDRDGDNLSFKVRYQF